MRTVIGVISSARFGWGGYQEVMLGLSLTFDMSGSAVAHFDGMWGQTRRDSCQWTEADRLTQLGEAVMRLGKVLNEAKKMHVEELVGVPVEVTLDGNLFKGWRVLTEAIR